MATVSQPRPLPPANQDTNRGGWTVDGGRDSQSPNMLWDPISADLGTHMDDASRVSPPFTEPEPEPEPGSPPLPSGVASRPHPAYRLSGTQPGQRQPVRRDSQDGGNPPGPGRFACVPCLSWLAGGGGMCSHPRKKKKRCCNVPLMRRPLARMAGWQAEDRARGRWATQVMVASGGLHLSPCLKLTDFSCRRRLSPPWPQNIPNPSPPFPSPLICDPANLQRPRPRRPQAAVEFFQSPPADSIHGPGPSTSITSPSRSPLSAPPL